MTAAGESSPTWAKTGWQRGSLCVTRKPTRSFGSPWICKGQPKGCRSKTFRGIMPTSRSAGVQPSGSGMRSSGSSPRCSRPIPASFPSVGAFPLARVSGFASVSAEELADLAAGVSSVATREHAGASVERRASHFQTARAYEARRAYPSGARSGSADRSRRASPCAQARGPRSIPTLSRPFGRRSSLAVRSSFTTSTGVLAGPASIPYDRMASTTAAGIISSRGARTNRRVISGICAVEYRARRDTG